ncbi:MAG: tape measure protein [Acidobacteria bacterium]|nr:tape measure protein [Acidobacteriota bacterium]
MPGDLDLALRIRADLRQAVSELKRLNRAVDETGDESVETAQQTQRLSSAIGRLRVARQAAQELDRASRAVDRLGREEAQTERRTERLRRSLGRLRGVGGALGIGLGGFAVVQAVREYTQLADTVTELRSRLDLVTDSERERVAVERQLLSLSQETRAEYASTVELYARIARSTEHLNRTDEERLRVTRAVQQAVRISGATHQEAAASVIQFAQGLASNRLAGEELRSVLEQNPRLAQAIADGLDTNIGKLRELAADGVLTSEVVFSALLSQADRLEREFGEVERTVGQAVTQLSNEFLTFIGVLDEGAGVSETLVGWLDRLRAGVQGLRDDLADEPLTPADIVDDLEALREQRTEVDRRIAVAGANEARRLQAVRRRLTREIGVLEAQHGERLDRSIEDLEAERDALLELPEPGSNRERRIRRGDIVRLERQIAEARGLQLREQIEETLSGIEVPSADRLLENVAAQLGGQRDPFGDVIAELFGDVDTATGPLADLASRYTGIADAAFGELPKGLRKALEEAEVNLLEGLEREIAVIEVWRAQMQGQLDLNVQAHREASAEIDRIADARIAQARENAAEEEALEAERERKAQEREARAAERAEQRFAREQRRVQDANRRAEEEAERAAEHALRTARDARTGAYRALSDIAFFATDAGAQIEGAVAGAFQGMEEAIVQLRRTGEFEFGQLIDAILDDLTRLAVQQQITGPLAQALAGLFAPRQAIFDVPTGSGSRFAGFAHGGGIAGALRVGRRLPAWVFQDAPRFHRGGIAGQLRPDERPAVLRTGEGVFTPEQMAALGGPGIVRVELSLETRGTPQRVVESSAQLNGGQLVASMVLEDLAADGPIDRTFRRKYGLRPQL